MRPLDTIFSEFLEQSGVKQDIALGPQEDSTDFGATPEHKAWLFSQLRENAKFNRSFIILLIVLHFLIFLSAIIGGWLVREDAGYVVGILGGSGAGIYAILSGLRKLWREKVIIESVIAILPGLPPRESVEVIQSLVFTLLKRGKDK